LRISPFYKIKDSHSFFLQVVVNASKLWVWIILCLKQIWYSNMWGFVHHLANNFIGY
jgi:hypothetical protein